MDDKSRYKIEVMNHILNDVVTENQTTSDIIYYWKKEDYSRKDGRSYAFKCILYMIPLFFCFLVYCFPKLNDWDTWKIFSTTINWKQVDFYLLIVLLWFFLILFFGMKIYIKFVEKPKEEMIKKSESYIKVFDDRLELKYLPGSMKVNMFSDDQSYSDMIIYYNNIQSIHIKWPDFFKSLALFSNIWLRGLEWYRRCYRDIYIVKTDGDRVKFPELMLRDFFEMELKKRKINVVRDK